MTFIDAQIFVPGKGSSAGAIAGGVVGGLVALVLGVLLILFYRRRKGKQDTLLPSSEESIRLGNDKFFFLMDFCLPLIFQHRVILEASFVKKH